MPKKAYLQPEELVKKSRMHTSYAGDGAIHGEGKAGKLYKMEFTNGIARDVDEQTFQRFKDLGHCNTSKPRIAGSDDD